MSSVLPSDSNQSLGELWRRVQILEAIKQQSGSYLQGHAYKILGDEWRRILSLNNVTGGNGTDPTGGSWTAFQDLTVPWGGYIETAVDGDWVPFSMPNLGPRGSGYAVAVWYESGPDCGDISIEWGTSTINEFDDAGVGSTTSILGTLDDPFFGGTPIDWYNTANTADVSHTYKFKGYTAGVDPSGLVVERSPFWIGGVDGTMLTANAGGVGNFEWNREFNGGGGPLIAWWCRLRVDGHTAPSTGYRARIFAVTVTRFNGGSQALN